MINVVHLPCRRRFHKPKFSRYQGNVAIKDADRASASATVRADVKPGDTIHLIADVTDSGKPPLTRYAHVIITVSPVKR